jgi:dTDP-4-dehydrorhamnose 3,5-epimerase
MVFTETPLGGAFVLDVEERHDSRGLFARTYCRKEFEDHGLEPDVVQGNLSFNHRKGTLRGMHFQYPPAAETKLVRCTRGAILDVIVDLRPESPTFLQHTSVELTADNRRSLFVPKRFAHGYQVLEDATEVAYLTGEYYAPQHDGGLPYDDPRLAIAWRLPVADMSDRDRQWPRLDQTEATIRARMAAGAPAGSGSAT